MNDINRVGLLFIFKNGGLYMNDKVAIYCRLSEEDKNKKYKDDDSGSIQNQKLMLTEYAFNHNWKIYDIYSDDDYTGSDRNRPEFNRMINDAKSKKFNIILCKTQSRFTRELEIVESYIHNLFPKLGIRFVSIVDNIDTDIAGNKKTRQINGLINEWYLEDMSESIKAALKTRMKAGYFIGSFAPYGYKKDPDNKGHLIIDENTADIVREIFSLYNQGVGRTGIARILNEQGIPSPVEYYRMSGISTACKKNGKYWKYHTVSSILSNEVYIGNLVQGKTYNPTYKFKHTIPANKELWIRKEHTHEPIIDIETWNLTRQLWKTRSKPCYVGEPNIFSGKLVCSKCGYKMITAYNKHKRYYRCGSAKYGKICCEGTNIFETTLQQAVIREARQIRKQYLNENISFDIDKLSDISQKRINKFKNILFNYEKKIKEINNALKNLYIDKLKGIITTEQFNDLAKQFEQEKNEYLLKIDETNKKLSSEKSFGFNIEKRDDFIRQISSCEHISREFVISFIKYITIGGDRNNREINIYWNF